MTSSPPLLRRRAAARQPDTWDEHVACYKQADALFREGRLKAALEHFRAALLLAPGDVDTLWGLADCCSDMGRAPRAERLYRAARMRAGRGQRGDLLYNIANALFDQGRLGAALALYRRVPRTAKAHRLAVTNARLVGRALARCGRR